jgi:hypothetical protein
LRSLVRTSLLGVVAATIPLGFACSGGGPEKVDAGDWVAEVCDAAIDFENELQESAESLQVLAEGDPDEIKEAIDQFSNDAKETIDGFVKEVEAVGKPDIMGAMRLSKPSATTQTTKKRPSTTSATT